MMPLLLMSAMATMAVFAQDTPQPQPNRSAVDPDHNKALDSAIERLIQSGRNGVQFKLDEREGRCYFIATRPVKPGPDQGMLRDIPAAPPIDNMPVVKPGPTCSSVR